MVTPTYAALLAILYVLLSIRVIRLRRSTKTSLGAGADESLERAIRAHGNCSEYVPLALLLLLCCEISIAPQSWLLHLLGITLLTGRLLHSYGLSRSPEDFRFRVGGMVLTLSTILSTSSLILGG